MISDRRARRRRQRHRQRAREEEELDFEEYLSTSGSLSPTRRGGADRPRKEEEEETKNAQTVMGEKGTGVAGDLGPLSFDDLSVEVEASSSVLEKSVRGEGEIGGGGARAGGDNEQERHSRPGETKREVVGDEKDNDHDRCSVVLVYPTQDGEEGGEQQEKPQEQQQKPQEQNTQPQNTQPQNMQPQNMQPQNTQPQNTQQHQQETLQLTSTKEEIAELRETMHRQEQQLHTLVGLVRERESTSTTLLRATTNTAQDPPPSTQAEQHAIEVLRTRCAVLETELAQCKTTHEQEQRTLQTALESEKKDARQALEAQRLDAEARLRAETASWTQRQETEAASWKARVEKEVRTAQATLSKEQETWRGKEKSLASKLRLERNDAERARVRGVEAERKMSDAIAKLRTVRRERSVEVGELVEAKTRLEARVGELERSEIEATSSLRARLEEKTRAVEELQRDEARKEEERERERAEAQRVLHAAKQQISTLELKLLALETRVREERERAQRGVVTHASGVQQQHTPSATGASSSTPHRTRVHSPITTTPHPRVLSPAEGHLVGGGGESVITTETNSVDERRQTERHLSGTTTTTNSDTLNNSNINNSNINNLESRPDRLDMRSIVSPRTTLSSHPHDQTTPAALVGGGGDENENEDEFSDWDESSVGTTLIVTPSTDALARLASSPGEGAQQQPQKTPRSVVTSATTPAAAAVISPSGSSLRSASSSSSALSSSASFATSDSVQPMTPRAMDPDRRTIASKNGSDSEETSPPPLPTKKPISLVITDNNNNNNNTHTLSSLPITHEESSDSLSFEPFDPQLQQGGGSLDAARARDSPASTSVKQAVSGVGKEEILLRSLPVSSSEDESGEEDEEEEESDEEGEGGAVWQKVFDEKRNQWYYWNWETEESSWRRPEGYVSPAEEEEEEEQVGRGGRESAGRSGISTADTERSVPSSSSSSSSSSRASSRAAQNAEHQREDREHEEEHDGKNPAYSYASFLRTLTTKGMELRKVHKSMFGGTAQRMIWIEMMDGEVPGRDDVLKWASKVCVCVWRESSFVL